MSDLRKKSLPSTRFPRKKIKNSVASIMPKNRDFKLQVTQSGIGKLKVVRVITEAWKTKPNYERIEKVIKAVRPELTPEESDSILRFSVLTPAEYDEVVLGKQSR